MPGRSCEAPEGGLHVCFESADRSTGRRMGGGHQPGEIIGLQHGGWDARSPRPYRAGRQFPRWVCRLRSCHAGTVATRSPEERRADALAKLTATRTNVWVASASPTGGVHLIPVTHTWNGSQHVLTTELRSRTVANVTANPRVRLALGETRDVVMVDAVLSEAVPAAEAPATVADGYASQAGWDPRTDSGDYVYLVFRPERIQVWREDEDLAGRTVMRNGAWVI